jgi:hypothetical protein
MKAIAKAETIKQKSVKLENEIRKLVEEFHKEIERATIEVETGVEWGMLENDYCGKPSQKFKDFAEQLVVF